MPGSIKVSPKPHSLVCLRSVSKLLEAQKCTIVNLLGRYFTNKGSVIASRNGEGHLTNDFTDEVLHLLV